MTTSFRIIVSLLLVLAFTGCAGEWEAEIDSTTSWSGSFDGRTVDGRGDHSLEIGRGDVKCVVVQKQTESGVLRVRLRRTWLLGPDDETDWKSTTADYGVVSVCNDD